MSRNFIAILVITVVGMIALFSFAGSSDDESSTVASIINPREIVEIDAVKGPDTASVQLIEYADFGCPGCGALHPLILQLEEEIGDDVQFAFRHFPLISLHPNTMAAHRASVAAGQQGKFWEMHDLLYERQFEWTARSATQPQAIAIIEGYAGELELDIDQFNSDIASQETFDYIDSHQKSGNEIGLTGTPSLILNGEEISTPRSYDELKAVVEAAIEGSSAGSTNGSSETGDEPAATEPDEVNTQASETDETQ